MHDEVENIMDSVLDRVLEVIEAESADEVAEGDQSHEQLTSVQAVFLLGLSNETLLRIAAEVLHHTQSDTHGQTNYNGRRCRG